MANFLNEDEIRKAISILHPDNELFEIRILDGNSKANYSGYFTDADTLITRLKRQQLKDCNVYLTLQHVNKACYSRIQRNVFYKSVKTTTSDNDIDGYEWLFIDLDPKRPAGTSSSEDELKSAKALANKIWTFLGEQGFNKPLVAESGNGVHLLYRMSGAASTDMAEMIKQFLKAINAIFCDGVVDVDMKNFNPSRICKLYGTLAQKGSDTEDRPHRMARIVALPSDEPNDIHYIEKIVKMLPQEEHDEQNRPYVTEFNLDSWLEKYNIAYRKTSYADGTKYILDHCPFDENHKGKDACLFKRPSGAIGFLCFHNSCNGKTWQDFRKLYEPDAYNKKYERQQKIMYDSHNRYMRQKPVVEPLKEKDGVPILLTAKNILDIKTLPESFIRTGINEIDKRMRGLKKSYVTVMTGLRGSAKSTLLSEIILNAVDAGNNVGCFSGELSPKNFMRWMYLQAAGKDKIENTQYAGYYNVGVETQRRIAEWMGDHFWLYNNDYGNQFEAILEEFDKAITEKKLDLLILDNLMAFNITSLAETKFDAQAAFVWALQRLAKKHNVHIIFVAHPRKAMGFLRLDDISGTGDIGNAVDNAFIVHRNNNDFRRLSKDMFRWDDTNDVYQGTNVIEIAKDRDGGTQDVFIPLWYEVETKRLKNSLTENKVYGWRDDNRKTDRQVALEVKKAIDDSFLTAEPNDNPFL